MRKKIFLVTVFLFVVPCSIAHAGFGDTIFQDWFIRPIQEFLLTLLQTALGGIADWISSPTDLYQYEFVSTSIQVAKYIGFSLLTVNTMKEFLQTILTHSQGEGGKSIEKIFIDTVKSGLLVGLSVWILETLLSINNSLVRVITESGNFSLTEASKVTAFDATLSTNDGALAGAIGSFLLMSVVILVFGLCLLVLAVMAALRYSQLVVLAVLAPILAVSVAGKKEAYQIWIRETIAVVFTQAFQYWLLWLVVSVLMKNAMLRSLFDVVNFWNYLVAIGVIVMMIVSPSVLKKYLHSSGVGGAATSAAKFGAYRAMMPKFPMK